MTAIKKIVYPLAMLLITALFSDCAHTEPDGPVERDEDNLVAVELVATGGSVQLTRAAGMIDNAIVLVFDQGGTLLHYSHLDYANGERVYLRMGTYQIFAVANLTDDNCPNSTAATYLNDVTAPAQLDGKYLLSTPAMPDKILMCSDVVTKIISSNTVPVTIDLKRIQTKIDLNIYNRIDGSGNISSGVELHSYYTNNLPLGSFLVERPTSVNPYDYQTTGYGKSSPVNFSSLTSIDTTLGDNSYRKYKVEILTFENRRGTVGGVSSNMYNRKELAPEFALEINILGYVNGKVLNTFVLVGKGRDEKDPPDEWYGDFNVDRNCIYHVNVIIDKTTNIVSDSRREYLELLVCGDLESPSEGAGAEF